MQKSTIFIEKQWYEIPQEGGVIPGTTLEAKWLNDRAGAFSLRKLALVNTGKTAVKLGSCHLLEEDDIPDFTSESSVFLDSGGGWPTGVIKTSEHFFTPRYAWEYWLPVYQPAEERAWAAQIMGVPEEELPKGVRGANYSFGGVAAVQHKNSGMVYAFTAPMTKCNTCVYILCDGETGALRRLAFSCNFCGFELQPGARIESEEMATGAFKSAQRGLEAWADMSVQRSNIKLRHTEPPVGWLSWYGYRLTISAEEINRIADFINATYPGFGFKYMQIDLGYCHEDVPGRWQIPNDRFPGGLEKFTEEMRKRNFVPGIWCSLYEVEEGTVPGAAMETKSKWFWEPHCDMNILDPTHPKVKEYVAKTMRYYKSLGIKYFKIDFLNRCGRVDFYTPWDKGVVQGAGTYRQSLKNIVEELDQEDFLYACSDLTMHSAGLCSTTMSACDIGNTGIRDDAEKTEFFREQFTSTMSRYFAQNKIVMLTADAINIAPPADLEEARMRTLFVGISGGQIFLGDKFQECSPEVLDLVRRVLPPWGKVAVPVDLFAGRTPEIFLNETPDRDIYSFFNFEEEKEMELKLPDDREYHVWNFFEERYEGKVKGSFKPTLPRVSARVYALTPVEEAPQVIGTSFHYTCGAQELKDLRCENGKLKGTLTRPAGDRGRIFIMDQKGKVQTLELTGTGAPLDWEF